MKLWRSRGLKSLLYLDDGIVAVNGKESAGKASMWVKISLKSAGFMINDAKSVWMLLSYSRHSKRTWYLAIFPL